MPLETVGRLKRRRRARICSGELGLVAVLWFCLSISCFWFQRSLRVLINRRFGVDSFSPVCQALTYFLVWGVLGSLYALLPTFLIFRHGHNILSTVIKCVALPLLCFSWIQYGNLWKTWGDTVEKVLLIGALVITGFNLQIFQHYITQICTLSTFLQVVTHILHFPNSGSLFAFSCVLICTTVCMLLTHHVYQWIDVHAQQIFWAEVPDMHKFVICVITLTYLHSTVFFSLLFPDASFASMLVWFIHSEEKLADLTAVG